jgi:hypothetical protein
MVSVVEAKVVMYPEYLNAATITPMVQVSTHESTPSTPCGGHGLFATGKKEY